MESILPARLESITEPEEIKQSEKPDNQSKIGLVCQVQLAEQTEKRGKFADPIVIIIARNFPIQSSADVNGSMLCVGSTFYFCLLASLDKRQGILTVGLGMQAVLSYQVDKSVNGEEFRTRDFPPEMP